jgi:cell division protein FtsQ
MDRSRRGERRETEAPAPPSSSRLTVRKRNRRRPTTLWSRVPGPKQVVDACGRAIRRGVPAIVATVAITGLGSGLWLGYRFVTTSDRFAIDHIEVRGTDRLTPDQVKAAMPVSSGENLITTDLDEVTQALRAEPWIATVEVRRQLPRTLIVEIREHQPAVVIALPSAEGNELYLGDAAGRPFKRAGETERSDLPLVTGIARDDYRRDPDGTARRVVAALDTLRLWHTADRLAIQEIRFDVHGGISLIARDPAVAIELGLLAELPARLRTFDAVWSELGTDERSRVRTIHLGTRLDHVTVSFKD